MFRSDLILSKNNANPKRVPNTLGMNGLHLINTLTFLSTGLASINRNIPTIAMMCNIKMKFEYIEWCCNVTDDKVSGEIIFARFINVEAIMGAIIISSPALYVLSML